MNLYLVWCPDRGQTKEYACQYRANDEGSAACEWAKGDDAYSGDRLSDDGGFEKVIVAEANYPERQTKFIVDCKIVRQYSARVDIQP